MALPALVSGADCGPLNPLQSLSKQFDRDRGIQQVIYHGIETYYKILNIWFRTVLYLASQVLPGRQV